MPEDAGYFGKCFLTICIYSVDISLQFHSLVLTRLFIFLMFGFLSSSCLLDTHFLSKEQRFYSHSVGYLLAHLTVSFVVSELCKFRRPHLSNVGFISHVSKSFWKPLPRPISRCIDLPLLLAISGYQVLCWGLDPFGVEYCAWGVTIVTSYKRI